MVKRLITDIEQLSNIIEQFTQKSTLTNNFILLEDYRQYVDTGRLSVVVGEKNLFFLLKKNGFSQLYYYINNLDESVCLETEEPVVMEILYRGEKFFPTDVIDYWKQNGFIQHLSRDLMANSINKIVLPESVNDNVVVTYAKKESEIEYAYNIIKNTFDTYTGDILSREEVKRFAQNDEILLATIDGESCGILQLEIKNNVSWLGHIAVDPSFRQQGIANVLVNAWIKRTADQPKARYQLWVIQDNTPALRLYNKYGFVYANKSTISMLKNN